MIVIFFSWFFWPSSVDDSSQKEKENTTIKGNNNKYGAADIRFSDLPSAAIINTMAYTVGHIHTRYDRWHPYEHYRNRRCGPICECCVALATRRPGCWECKAYGKIKRLSFKFCLMSEYRTINIP